MITKEGNVWLPSDISRTITNLSNLLTMCFEPEEDGLKRETFITAANECDRTAECTHALANKLRDKANSLVA